VCVQYSTCIPVQCLVSDVMNTQTARCHSQDLGVESGCVLKGVLSQPAEESGERARKSCAPSRKIFRIFCVKMKCFGAFWHKI